MLTEYKKPYEYLVDVYNNLKREKEEHLTRLGELHQDIDGCKEKIGAIEASMAAINEAVEKLFRGQSK